MFWPKWKQLGPQRRLHCVLQVLRTPYMHCTLRYLLLQKVLSPVSLFILQ